MEPALLRRYGERGAYDLAAVKGVFDDCFIAHVAFVADDGLPACQPMLAVVEAEGDGAGAVYLHGHPTAALMQRVRTASREGTDPVKVCITSTKIDGLVLSTAPNGHSFNYRSATIHGTCSPLEAAAAGAPAEGDDVVPAPAYEAYKARKAAVLHAVTDKIVPGRWREVNPVSSLALGLVYVVHVRIDRLSTKTRTGVPGIQPRRPDLDGPDVVPPAWAGVVPLWETLGPPVDAGLTPGAEPPASLGAYIEARNAAQAAHARGVAR